MAVKSERKKRAQAAKAKRRAAQYTPGGESKYARKRVYLARHGLWGSEVPEPKPWKIA